jgi:DNA end-binding protein Ku
MPARAISSGTITFGLVSIPIKVYTATSSQSVHFNMLHEPDKGRLKQHYTCSVCNETVERNDTVRGYEYQRGQYVVLADEELAALEHKSDRTIEIEEFVPLDKVDPIYFERSQYLGPDKGGHKAYRLLREAMRESGRVAIGRFSTRGREQLVLLRPTTEGLILHGLFYADEVRGFGDIELPDEEAFKPGELELAGQLIEQLAKPRFEPEKFEDEYRQSVLAAIERKVAGQEIVAVPAEQPREQIIDLVAALKASLAEKRGKGEPGAGAEPARKPAKAKGKGGAASARKSARR